MYRHNEDQYDQYYLSIAAIIIAISVLSLYCWSHSTTAIKYKVLSHFGVEATALITSSEIDNRLRLKELGHSTNGFYAVSEIKFTFTASDGSFNSSIIHLDGCYAIDEKTKNWEYKAAFETGQIVAITYWPSHPTVIYPTQMLEKLAFDWTVFSRFFLTILFFLALLFWRIKSLNKFKAKMRYY